MSKRRLSERFLQEYERNNVFGCTILLLMWALAWAVVVGIVYMIVMLIRVL